jgi:DNA-binding XRE family transcriptional regulator
MNDENEDELYRVKHMTRQDVAAMLGVTPSAIGQWRKEKGLPYNREPGGKISYDSREVAEWYLAREFAKLGRKRPEPMMVTCLMDAVDFIRENYPLVKVVNK